MKNQNIAKIASAVIALILILNIALFALGKLAPGVFWIVIILSAVFAYFLLPKLKK